MFFTFQAFGNQHLKENLDKAESILQKYEISSANLQIFKNYISVESALKSLSMVFSKYDFYEK